MTSKFLIPFAFAFIAALGNVFFVFVNRKVEGASNPFLFSAGTMAVSLAIFGVLFLFFGTRGAAEYTARNGGWMALSGLGIFLTFFGFYLLYSRYDTSYYALFAVTALILTVVVLGAWILREGLNFYGILSVAAAVVSIVFFALSKR
jgi:drug/metabolite transporter (DMT)-like permease